MPGDKCARKTFKMPAHYGTLQPETKNFKGFSLPDLPRDLQTHILSRVKKRVGADGTPNLDVVTRRLALLRRLNKDMAAELLGRMCLATLVIENKKHVKLFRECTQPTIKLVISNFMNRDVIATTMIATFTKEIGMNCAISGRAAFRCTKALLKLHDVETAWITACLTAIENRQPTPPMPTANSCEVWLGVQNAAFP
tara:strand:+ start:20176 stop:20766 length:591 start_codon:yes stop_codon:yes gene_type:complete